MAKKRKNRNNKKVKYKAKKQIDQQSKTQESPQIDEKEYQSLMKDMNLEIQNIEKMIEEDKRNIKQKQEKKFAEQKKKFAEKRKKIAEQKKITQPIEKAQKRSLGDKVLEKRAKAEAMLECDQIDEEELKPKRKYEISSQNARKSGYFAKKETEDYTKWPEYHKFIDMLSEAYKCKGKYAKHLIKQIALYETKTLHLQQAQNDYKAKSPLLALKNPMIASFATDGLVGEMENPDPAMFIEIWMKSEQARFDFLNDVREEKHFYDESLKNADGDLGRTLAMCDQILRNAGSKGPRKYNIAIKSKEKLIDLLEKRLKTLRNEEICAEYCHEIHDYVNRHEHYNLTGHWRNMMRDEEFYAKRINAFKRELKKLIQEEKSLQNKAAKKVADDMSKGANPFSEDGGGTCKNDENRSENQEVSKAKIPDDP